MAVDSAVLKAKAICKLVSREYLMSTVTLWLEWAERRSICVAAALLASRSLCRPLFNTISLRTAPPPLLLSHLSTILSIRFSLFPPSRFSPPSSSSASALLRGETDGGNLNTITGHS